MFSDYTNNGMIDICFKVEIEDTYTEKIWMYPSYYQTMMTLGIQKVSKKHTLINMEENPYDY